MTLSGKIQKGSIVAVLGFSLGVLGTASISAQRASRHSRGTQPSRRQADNRAVSGAVLRQKC